MALFTKIVAGSLVAAVLSTAACAAPVEQSPAEPSGGEGALSPNEHLVSVLIAGSLSQSPEVTGVDTWDIGVVSDGKDAYVVATGFKGYSEPRTPVVELLATGGMVEGKSQLLARSPDPDQTLSLSREAMIAIGDDFESMKPALRDQVKNRCDRIFAEALGTTAVALTGAAVFLCAAATDGVCAAFLAVPALTWAGTYKLAQKEACPTR